MRPPKKRKDRNSPRPEYTYSPSAQAEKDAREGVQPPEDKTRRYYIPLPDLGGIVPCRRK